MHLYVELWRPRQAWLDLSKDERQAYVEQVSPGIGRPAEGGVELVGIVLSDEDTPHRADHRYPAAGTMPGREQAGLLERIPEEAGWHTSFEQTNARGEAIQPAQALAEVPRFGRAVERTARVRR